MTVFSPAPKIPPKPPRSRRPLKKSGRPKAKKRSASEFARIYGSRARVAFVKNLPCLMCDALAPIFGALSAGKCDNAHTETGGMGRKAGYATIIPLCRSHHKRYDERKAPFNDPKLRDLAKRSAADIEAAWQLFSGCAQGEAK